MSGTSKLIRLGMIAALVFLGLSTGGCGNSETPETESTPSPASPTVETKTETPTPTPTPEPELIVLSADGIGPFGFGAPREEVSSYLTAALGSPTTNPEFEGVGECEGGYGKWQSNETYGDLVVEYDGDDASPTSPQSLAAWNITPLGEPLAPLALAPGIPFDLSWAELQAQYPDGGGLEHMNTWFADAVAITPPDPATGFGGRIFAGRINWCT